MLRAVSDLLSHEILFGLHVVSTQPGVSRGCKDLACIGGEGYRFRSERQTTTGRQREGVGEEERGGREVEGGT